jgi:hypothetical protein
MVNVNFSLKTGSQIQLSQNAVNSRQYKPVKSPGYLYSLRIRHDYFFAPPFLFFTLTRLNVLAAFPDIVRTTGQA